MNVQGERIKPLVKKMGREEIEELCDRKGWTLIDFETASMFVDDIPYSTFWVAGYSVEKFSDTDIETRPNVAFKKDGELFLTTCHPNWLQNCVVLRREQTVMSTYEDILSMIEKAVGIEGINRSEILALGRVKKVVEELIHARREYERAEAEHNSD